MITREAALERAGSLGLELKITARDLTFKDWAAIEVKETMSGQTDTLRIGATSHFGNNTTSLFTEIPDSFLGLKYNLQSAKPSAVTVKVQTPGKIALLVNTDHDRYAEYSTQLKALGAKTEASAIKTGYHTFTVFSVTLPAGKTVLFRGCITVLAGEIALAK